MAEINISNHVLDGGRSQLQSIIDWLVENVGEYYGRGDHPVMRIGSGWEIRSVEDNIDDGISIGWVVDITDESKSTMFALRWL